jgi:hypothetical protein
MAQADVVSPLLSDLRSLRGEGVSIRGRRGLDEETSKAALIIPLLKAQGSDTSDVLRAATAPGMAFLFADQLRRDVTSETLEDEISVAQARNDRTAAAIRADFGRLVDRAQRERWTDASPVCPAAFGEMWPVGDHVIRWIDPHGYVVSDMLPSWR